MQGTAHLLATARRLPKQQQCDAMTISFDASVTQNFEQAAGREWLETNGLGGWASSTISGAHSRRYHGMLVAATRPPVGRMVLLSKLDETLAVDGARFMLSANKYPGVIYPEGFRHLVSFSKELFPEFVFEAGGIRLRKTVAAVNGENTTLVLYEVLEAPRQFVMQLQPFMAPRDYHSLAHANDAIHRTGVFTNGTFRVQAYDGVPELFIDVPGSTFEPNPDWYRNFEYDIELERGLDFREDLFTHGVFSVRLKKGDRLGVIISTENPDGRNAFALLNKEAARRTGLLESLAIRDELSDSLALAADQFIVKRGEDLKTLIAGYHWFSDWGRDTMIALPGICLVTGRFDDAKRILRAFARSVSEGMLPNRFPDAGEQPEYNTVDATLWFFIAVQKYLDYTDDGEFVRDELLLVLREIIGRHESGTRYNIHVDTDGLLYAGEPGVQLTWMDAKVGDWVVTPRQGKAVEINALWYNALMIFGSLSDHFLYKRTAGVYLRRAEEVKQVFESTFWNPSTGCLYDHADGDYRDAAIRPNQIFALSLPYPLLEGARAASVLDVVERHLYTPKGLRSLSPFDPAYRPRYGGGPVERDGAYHQGTVWSWLLGPLADAIVSVEGEKGLVRARQILQGVRPHLAEAGIGTISEIFDAEPPNVPRGCIAQAWSVGELLRGLSEHTIEKRVEVADGV